MTNLTVVMTSDATLSDIANFGIELGRLAEKYKHAVFEIKIGGMK